VTLVDTWELQFCRPKALTGFIMRSLDMLTQLKNMFDVVFVHMLRNE